MALRTTAAFQPGTPREFLHVRPKPPRHQMEPHLLANSERASSHGPDVPQIGDRVRLCNPNSPLTNGGRVLRKAQNLRTQLQLPATESTSYKAYMQQQLETISSQDGMTETGAEVGTVLKSGRRYGGDCLVQFDSGSRIWAAPEELHVTAFGDRRLMPDDRPADPTGFLAKMTPMSNAFSTNDDFASTDLGAEPEQASSARDGNGTVASRLFKRMEFVDGENRLTAEEDERYRARRLQSQQQRLLVLQKMSTGSWDAKKVRESIAALKMDINRLKGNKNSSQEFTNSPSNAEAAKGEHEDENRAGCWPRVRVAANMRQLHTKIRHQRRPSVVNMVSDLVDEKRGTVKPSNLVHALRFSQKLTETKAWAKMTSECRLGKIIRSPNGTFCACFSANAAKANVESYEVGRQLIHMESWDYAMSSCVREAKTEMGYNKASA